MLYIATQKDGVLKKKKQKKNHLSPWRERVLVDELRNCVSLTDCPYSREECFTSPYVWDFRSPKSFCFYTDLAKLWFSRGYACGLPTVIVHVCADTNIFGPSEWAVAHNPWAIKNLAFIFENLRTPVSLAWWI